MHIQSTISVSFLVFILASAVPTANPRGEASSLLAADPEPCSAQFKEDNGHCIKLGRLNSPGNHRYWGFTDHANSVSTNYARCAAECEKDYKCMSWSFKEDDALMCQLFDADLATLGFQADSSETRLLNQRGCYELTGICPIADNDFEWDPTNINGQGLEYHPWRFITGFNVMNNSSPGPFKKTTHFEKFLGVVNLTGNKIASLSQQIRIGNAGPYDLHYQYNFAHYAKLSGNAAPTGYTITVFLCGNVIDKFEMPKNTAKNQWFGRYKTFNLAPICNGSQSFYINFHPKDGSPNGNYQASLAIDDILIVKP